MDKNLLYIWKSILQIPLFAAIMAGLELLGMGVFVFCGVSSLEMIQKEEQTAYLLLLMGQMFAFCVMMILFCFWKKWENHEAVWKSRLGFGCVCAGCFAGMVFTAFCVTDVKVLSAGRGFVFWLLTGLNVLSYLFSFISKEKSRLETESRVYQKQAGLYQEWYEEFQKTRKETLAFRHDMNNHFGVLKYLCREENGKESDGRLSEIDKYIDSLGSNYIKTGCDTDSGNMMVDFAVDMKKNYAQSKGIPLESELQIPSEMKYSSMDLVIFLSNLLDNAIEACERMEQREQARIILKMQYKMSNLVVLIKNTYDGHLDGQSEKQKKYASLPTSKEDKAAHGIGMKNVMDIVEKYNGIIRWEAEDGWFTVHALLYAFEEK